MRQQLPLTGLHFCEEVLHGSCCITAYEQLHSGHHFVKKITGLARPLHLAQVVQSVAVLDNIMSLPDVPSFTFIKNKSIPSQNFSFCLGHVDKRRAVCVGFTKKRGATAGGSWRQNPVTCGVPNKDSIQPVHLPL
jgi:hypothetical protein